jgi:hypothetical protein
MPARAPCALPQPPVLLRVLRAVRGGVVVGSPPPPPPPPPPPSAAAKWGRLPRGDSSRLVLEGSDCAVGGGWWRRSAGAGWGGVGSAGRAGR